MVDHPVIIRPATFANAVGGVTILQRTERSFIPAILNGLKTDQGRSGLASTSIPPAGPGQNLKLFQPVHQLFTVAVIEVCCDTYGTPRLDPVKIDSCGLVLRRLKVDDLGNNVEQAWCKSADTIQGWITLTSVQQDWDPDPTKRPVQLKSGNPEIDLRLSQLHPLRVPMAESVSPLFVAPPDACQAAKRTVLYGVVPLTSTEVSEAAGGPPSFNPDDVMKTLPFFLLPANNGRRPGVPTANATLVAGDKDRIELAPFVTALVQVKIELDAFGSSSASTAFFAFLNSFSLQDGAGKFLANLGDFLESAATVLLDKESGSSVQMPSQWPDFTDADRNNAARLAYACLQARSAGIVGGERRYQDPSALYRLRPFTRVKRSDGCPPKLFWGNESDPFKIAPWYDSAGLPPVRIDLPDPTADFLKSLKPNVAFSVPPKLFAAMQSDAKSAVQGAGSGGTNLGVTWVCSFSIPIITICAFFVLNIFLTLFDIIFFWMLFVKICIPIPSPKKT